MISDAAIPVKEVDDARPCRTCGRPTWSLAGLCVGCKASLSPEERAALPRATGSARWPETLLLRMPPEIRYRFIAQLVRDEYRVPLLIIVAGVWILSLLCTFVLSAVVLGTLGPLVLALTSRDEVELLGVIVITVFLGVFVLPLATAFIVTSIVSGKIRRGVLLHQIVDRGATVTLRTCPACGYDQKGTPGAACPECAFPIEYAKDVA